MFDRITAAVNYTRKQSPESFLVASHWNETDNTGVVLINRQTSHHKYAVWSVGATGSRYSGYFSSVYADVVSDFNDRVMRLVSREGR